MTTAFRTLKTPYGKDARCFIDGGEPVFVLYDAPTGRHPAMTHLVIRNNPNASQHVYKTMVGNRQGFVTDRAGIRELIKAYSGIECHREDTRKANATFLDWLYVELIPFLDNMDQELRDAKTPAPPKTYSGFMLVTGDKVGQHQVTAQIPFTNAEAARVRLGGPDFTETVVSIEDILRALKLVP